jgi:GTP-binding protein
LIFTKSDKQAKSKTQSNVMKFIQSTEEIFGEAPQYFITSAHTAEGKEDLVGFIENEVKEYYDSHK